MEAVEVHCTFGRSAYDLTARTHVMGILNVTPDSFSDGGEFFAPEDAVRRGMEMIEEGADFIDVGGASSRPGSDPVSVDEELRRVLPVVERLARASAVPVSIDTWRARVAAEALDAGAVIVNDITGLRGDPQTAAETSRRGASLVVMHMKGTPKTMQDAPSYGDLIGEISAALRASVAIARAAGIAQVFVDPGIGFGKTPRHNLEILRRLGEFRELGCPILVGPSRKSFIGAVLDLPTSERLEGTAAAVAVAVLHGASIVRVHDVRAMKRVAALTDAVARS